MSETTSSTSPVQMNSESSLANDPLLLLLQPKDLNSMTLDEIREEVNKLRTLRTGAQSLGKALRQGAAKAKAKSESGSAGKAQGLDDILGALGV